MYIIKFFRDDFRRCRQGLNEVLNRKIPLWIFVIYYIVLGAMLFPLLPLAIGLKYYFERKLRKILNEEA